MACYILGRKKKRPWMLFVAAIGCMLAIAAKETALFVPLAFAIYDVVFYGHVTGRHFYWKVLLPSLLLLAVVGIHTLFHLPTAVSSVTLNVGQVVRHVLLYLSIQTLTTPRTYSEITITPFSLAVERLAALGLLILALMLLLTRRRSIGDRQRSLSLGFCLVMVFVALLPAIFVFTERTAFLSSAFVSLALSCLFVLAWDRAARRRRAFRALVLAGLVLWVSAQTITLVRRNFWWGQAGAVSRAVMEQLGERVAGLPSDAQVWLLGLPDHFENAYVFRNAFPRAAQVLGYEQKVHAVLDVELADLSREDRARLESQLRDSRDVVVLWYTSGLILTSPAQNTPR